MTLLAEKASLRYWLVRSSTPVTTPALSTGSASSALGSTGTLANQGSDRHTDSGSDGSARKTVSDEAITNSTTDSGRSGEEIEDDEEDEDVAVEEEEAEDEAGESEEEAGRASEG